MRALLGMAVLAVSLALGPCAAAAESEVVPPLGPYAAAVEPEIVPPPSRDVTPPGVTPAPFASGPLIRDKLPLPPSPPDPARWHRFELPVTTDAATLVTRERIIRIAGVMALPRAMTCRSAAIGDWPCGSVALEALRHFLLGRPVECSFLTADKSNPLVAPCRVGRTDLGSWLLRWGWVTAAANASDDYRRAAAQARCAGLGVWHRADAEAGCAATGEPHKR
jgi:endonuclease YncB( thermonuclease family)